MEAGNKKLWMLLVDWLAAVVHDSPHRQPKVIDDFFQRKVNENHDCKANTIIHWTCDDIIMLRMVSMEQKETKSENGVAALMGVIKAPTSVRGQHLKHKWWSQ